MSNQDSRETPAAKGSNRHRLIVRGPDGSLVFGPGGRESLSSSVDIVFVFDTTGSMSDKIDGLVESTVLFIERMAQLGLNSRISCVPFGDLTVPGDRIVTHIPFVSDPEEAEEIIRHMPRFSGGGNDGESSGQALIAGAAKPFREGAVPVLVLITDEPALLQQVTNQDVLRAITRREALCFVASPDTKYFKDWARLNGGTWHQIEAAMDYTDLSRILLSMVLEIAETADEVHRLANGSVRRYLSLGPGG